MALRRALLRARPLVGNDLRPPRHPSARSLLHSHATSFGLCGSQAIKWKVSIGDAYQSAQSAASILRIKDLDRNLHQEALQKDFLDQAQLERFKNVEEEEKSKLVNNVFSNVASNYDLMNDLMSAGMHRLWKDRFVSKLHPFPGMKHLDVAGGTGKHLLFSSRSCFQEIGYTLDGDIAFRILEGINSVSRITLEGGITETRNQTEIYVCDINANMLNVGKRRAVEKGFGEDGALRWIVGDAEALSFADNSMDGYTIAFGIRNVTHIEKVLAEAYRVLRRGGRFLCLELSHVEIPVLKQIYDYYSFSIIPIMGELVASDCDSYQYLVESIRRFPSQDKFAGMIAGAGFQRVDYENLVGGVVAIHSGLKI